MSRTKKQRRRLRRELRANPSQLRRLRDDGNDLAPRRRAFGSYEITWEPLKLAAEADPVFDHLPDDQRQALFDQVSEDPEAAIAALSELLDKAPDCRTLRNWLTTAYSLAGDNQSAEREARLAFERQPDYLFAKIAWGQFCLNRGETNEIPKIFGGKFDLKELYPERNVFHITEFLAFARLFGEYFMRTGQQAKGESLYRAMKKLEPDHSLTQQMREVIAGLQLLRRAAKSDFRMHLTRSIETQRAQGFGWRWDGLDGWTTDAIFAQLRDLGIDTDAERFHHQAAAARDFKSLHQDWLRQIRDDKRNPRFWEDFPLLAVPVLWKRLANDLICPELLEARLYCAVEAEENETPLPHVNGVPGDIDAALGLVRYLQTFASSERPARYQEVVAGSFYDYADWLLDLIENRGREYPDTATQIADMMSECGVNAEHFQANLALALATNPSRHDQARARALANVQRFPSDLWVRAWAGDVFEQTGDEAEAERLWREALPLAEDSSDWEAVIERMEELFDRTGRQAELYEIVRAHPDPDHDPDFKAGLRPILSTEAHASAEPMTLTEPVARATKVGRNDPCPCGSGKKYKKCCLH